MALKLESSQEPSFFSKLFMSLFGNFSRITTYNLQQPLAEEK